MTRSPAPELVPPAELFLAFPSVGSFLLCYATQLCKGQIAFEGAAPLPTGTPLTLWIDVPGRSAFPLAATALAPLPPADGSTTFAARVDPATSELGTVVDEIAAYFSGFRLLLATGEPAPRAILNRYLRSILSCHIIEVDRERGFDPATAPLDLVIIDLDSMGEAALALMRDLREHEARGTFGPSVGERGGRLPILVLSEQEDRRFAARAHGADEALSNPPLLAEIQSSVRGILARPGVRIVAPPAN